MTSTGYGETVTEIGKMLRVSECAQKPSFSFMRSLLVIGASETLSRSFIEIFDKRGWRVETCGKHWDTAIARLAGNKSFDAVILTDSVLDKSVLDLIKLVRSL